MDMRTQIEATLACIGVEWHDSVTRHLDHPRRRKRIGTPSARQVTEPMYRNVRYRWHHYRHQLAPVLPRFQPFIEKFGYDM